MHLPRTFNTWSRRPFIICTEYVLTVDCSAMLSQQGCLHHLSCCVQTTVMPCWLVSQFSHWHHFSEFCTPRHVLFGISSHVAMWPGSPRVALVTSRRVDLVLVVLAGPQVTSCTYTDVPLETYWRQLRMYWLDLHCMLCCQGWHFTRVKWVKPGLNQIKTRLRWAKVPSDPGCSKEHSAL